jgi:STAM-binding protein
MVPPLIHKACLCLLQLQADDYRRTQNLEQLYLMLLRYVSLVAETMPSHQAYNKEDASVRALRRTAAAMLEELEGLKRELSDIAKMHEDTPYLPKIVPDAVQMSSGDVPGLHWNESIESSMGAGSTVQIEGLEDLGTDNWQHRLALEQRTTPLDKKLSELPAALAKPPSMAASTDSGKFELLYKMASPELQSKHAILPDSTFTSQIEGDVMKRNDHDNKTLVPTNGSYSTLLASLDENKFQAADTIADKPSLLPSPYGMEVRLGPQEIGVDVSKQATSSLPTSQGVAEVRRRQKLRDVHISLKLMDDFLRFAEANTRRSIETCGILAGSLSPDDACFSVTALIVPKQEGTSDTVQALAEEEIFDAQDSRGLYPLGWIHTHPTQTCFLSSIDVHTQCGYQTMLDEAVAIVMAPRDMKKRVGIFRLTTPGGLQLVQQCPLRGFHAHPPTKTGQELYELCGHVYINPRIGYEVVDLRAN